MDTSEGVKRALARPGMGVGIDWSRLSRETSDGTFPVKKPIVFRKKDSVNEQWEFHSISSHTLNMILLSIILPIKRVSLQKKASPLYFSLATSIIAFINSLPFLLLSLNKGTISSSKNGTASPTARLL